MTLIDTIEVVASGAGSGQVNGPVTSVTFGPAGDGKRNPTLSTNKRYILTGVWKKDTAVVVFLELRPNAASADRRVTRISSDDGGAVAAAPDNLLTLGATDTSFTATTALGFRAEFDIRNTGQSRPFFAISGYIDDPGTERAGMRTVGGGYTDTASAITSLVIQSSVALQIDVGSLFELYEEDIFLP